MNRRDFFKGLLGTGAAVAGIAVFPGPEPAIMKVRPKSEEKDGEVILTEQVTVTWTDTGGVSVHSVTYSGPIEIR